MKMSRSSFALITFCAAAAVAAALLLAAIFAGATLAFGAAAQNDNGAMQDSQTETFSGVVSDDRCEARHVPASNKTASECANMCVNKGSHFVLVNGDKSFLLENKAEELGKLAGQRVNVVGSLNGDTIRVIAVSLAP